MDTARQQIQPPRRARPPAAGTTMSRDGTPDPDDLFADTRMSFGDHIEELRVHLWRAIGGFVVALFPSFLSGQPAVNFVTAPVKAELQAFYNRRGQRTLEDLRKDDTKLTAVNQPTPFVQQAFRRDQLLALLQGKPAAEVNAFKRPVVPRGEGA